MPFLNNGDYRVRLASGRKIDFGIRNGKVRKISRIHFSEAEFREALAEASRALLGKPAAKTKQVCSVGALAHDVRMRKMLPDF